MALGPALGAASAASPPGDLDQTRALELDPPHPRVDPPALIDGRPPSPRSLMKPRKQRRMERGLRRERGLCRYMVTIPRLVDSPGSFLTSGRSPARAVYHIDGGQRRGC